MKVSVVGKGNACDPYTLGAATAAGRIIAELGHTLLTGARNGVMVAAAIGAAAYGGRVIGLAPLEEDPADGWPATAEVIHTGLHHTSRNIIMGTACDAMVACYGSHGTLQEIAFALDREVPICAFATDRWDPIRAYGAVAKATTEEQLEKWLSSLR